MCCGIFLAGKYVIMKYVKVKDAIFINALYFY